MPHVFVYPDLPIMARKEDILKALKDHQALVVQGGTGSGKTTQLPKFLLEGGYSRGGLIGMTQPRRIAALSIADRLRQETGQNNLIGAKIRFHDDMPAGAEIKVMTDGILLQEFRRDALLRQYACIILDEAHERSLNVDILLGIFKSLLPRRPEFRLIVTSATLDANRFAAFLASNAQATLGVPVPIIEVEGRQFPVSLEYWDISGRDADGDYTGDEGEDGEPVGRAFPPVEAAAIAIRELQARKPDNLLAFLPTEKEIHELQRELEKDLGGRFAILPLYSRLGPGDQKKVFQEMSQPKIILATNIAETSLTIPGIGYVVDTGLARISRYHAQTKIQGLPIERISQASARQRAGRAGRVKAGICVRLYAESDLNERPAYTEPEILRSNLANVVLQLLALDLDVENFPFPDPPAPAALRGALKQLHELGAVDDPGFAGRLTEEGRKLSRLPVDVAIGKILLKAQDLGVLKPALILAAGITVQDARFLPREEPERGQATGLHRRFEDPRSDFMSVLVLWAFIHRNWSQGGPQRKLRQLCLENFLSYNRVREWMELSEQFSRLLKTPLDGGAFQPEEVNADALHKSILSGFLPFLARRKPDEPSYRLAGDKEAFLHPGSGLSKRKPEWIVAGEVRQTSRVFIYRACEIKPTWVEEIAPEACKRSYHQITWNGERGFVEAVERVSYRGFALRQDRRVNYEGVDPEECAEIFWREGVIQKGDGAPFPFRAHNARVLESLAVLERKARLHGLVPNEDALAHWYRQHAPGVASRIGLERLLKESGEDKLAFSARDWTGALGGVEDFDWTGRSDGGAVTRAPSTGSTSTESDQPGVTTSHPLEKLFPETLRNAGKTYSLSYRFDFGDALDGISLDTDPEGLAALTAAAIYDGIPGLRKWIWEYALERMPAKAAASSRKGMDEIVPRWIGSAPGAKSTPGQPSLTAPGQVSITSLFENAPTPAAALAQAFTAHAETAGQANFPSVWPPHLQVHVFTRSANGRKFLLHLDPACGEAGFFLARRKLLCGENADGRPWLPWLSGALADFSAVPPPLSWREMGFGSDPIHGAAAQPDASRTGSSLSGRTEASVSRRNDASPTGASPSGACTYFASFTEAIFHRDLAQAHAHPPADFKSVAVLSVLFSKRLTALLDAWGCPEASRQVTSELRGYLCRVRLPALYLRKYGSEALAWAEKDLPPPRPPVSVKPGAQVKSLASLGQAVNRNGGSTAWAGAALCFGAGLISLERFTAWFRCLAQPPLESKAAVQTLLQKASQLPDWELLLGSPYYSALASIALHDFLPKSLRAAPEQTGTIIAVENHDLAGMDWDGLLLEWDYARARSEALRKGAKALRDKFCARLAAAGQSVAGQSKEIRAALDALDKPVAWTVKAEAALQLELAWERMAAKSAPALEAKSDTVAEARQVKKIQDLGSRFKKL